MLYDRTPLLELAQQALGDRNPEEFLKTGTKGIVTWLTNHPRRWQNFGPWWPQIQALLTHYQPKFNSRDWNGGEPPPDYLSRYSYRDDLLNYCAAMTYIDESDYLPPVDSPHSVVLPDNTRALYVPGVGLVDEERELDRSY